MNIKNKVVFDHFHKYLHNVQLDPLYVSQILVQAWTLYLPLIVGKSSHQCCSDSCGTTDRSGQGSQSLGHKGAPLSGLKPQTDKVGTLPRRRDTNTDSELRLLHSVFFVHCNELKAMPNLHSLPNNSIYHPLNSPHTSHEVPAQCGFPHEQLVGCCSLRPLWGVHGDRFNTRATAYGFLGRHNINIQQGHPEQGLPQETWHRSLSQRASFHKQHREKGTL